MMTKHFHLTQTCILPFSNIERGNEGADTYSEGITVMISCFCIFSNTICPWLWVYCRSSEDLVLFSMAFRPISKTGFVFTLVDRFSVFQVLMKMSVLYLV